MGGRQGRADDAHAGQDALVLLEHAQPFQVERPPADREQVGAVVLLGDERVAERAEQVVAQEERAARDVLDARQVHPRQQELRRAATARPTAAPTAPAGSLNRSPLAEASKVVWS